MSDYKRRTELLIEELKIKYPKFEIKFKDESKLMKFFGILAQFNKKFMSRYTTVIGYTVYFPSRKWMAENWRKTFYVLSHESIHMANHDANPIKHVLGYTFPQNLSVFSFIAVLAAINPAFLIFLAFLTALGPWPAPFRVKEETRGHWMNCKIAEWEGYSVSEEYLDRTAKKVCGWDYYNPLHPWKPMKKELKKYTNKDDSNLREEYLLVKKIYYTTDENL